MANTGSAVLDAYSKGLYDKRVYDVAKMCIPRTALRPAEHTGIRQQNFLVISPSPSAKISHSEDKGLRILYFSRLSAIFHRAPLGNDGY
jgi:hypothetical protein